jgi:hypothetical protein
MKKIFEKYKLLISFIVITLIIIAYGVCKIGLGDIQNSNDKIWGLLLVLDTATALALAVLAFFAYVEYAKGEDEITLKFDILDENLHRINVIPIQSNGENIKLLRKNVNRAEVLGIMGMVQKKSTGRYEINNKIQKLFLERINQIQKGKGEELLIPIIEKDYEKFFDTNILHIDDSVEILFTLKNDNKIINLISKLNISYKITSNISITDLFLIIESVLPEDVNLTKTQKINIIDQLGKIKRKQQSQIKIDLEKEIFEKVNNI